MWNANDVCEDIIGSTDDDDDDDAAESSSDLTSSPLAAELASCCSSSSSKNSSAPSGKVGDAVGRSDPQSLLASPFEALTKVVRLHAAILSHSCKTKQIQLHFH